MIVNRGVVLEEFVVPFLQVLQRIVHALLAMFELAEIAHARGPAMGMGAVSEDNLRIEVDFTRT